MLVQLESERDFLDAVITGYESWAFQYDPEIKRQSSERHTANSPRSKKARMSKSEVKTIFIVSFDKRGVAHKEFVPSGGTVNAAFYKEVLDLLHRAVKRKRPDIADRWKLHHNNVVAHTAFAVTTYLARIEVVTLRQPLYSPDASPTDLLLFPKLKRSLKGHLFDNGMPTISKVCCKE
nr:uncharacterized protein LOC126543204 [Dermacentor andersoni]